MGEGPPKPANSHQRCPDSKPNDRGHRDVPTVSRRLQWIARQETGPDAESR
jgi:hypothetical protein